MDSRSIAPCPPYTVLNSISSELALDGDAVPSVTRSCTLKRLRPASMSLEERCDIRHGPEQFHRLIGKWQKAFALVKSPRSLVLCIHHHGEGGNLAANGTTKRIGEQEPAVAFTLMLPIHGQPSQQRGRDEWISRQAAGHIGGKLGELHAGCRQSVIAADRTVGEDKYEWRCDILAGFLSCLRSEISIEWLDPTRKCAAIVLRSKDLDA